MSAVVSGFCLSVTYLLEAMKLSNSLVAPASANSCNYIMRTRCAAVSMNE